MAETNHPLTVAVELGDLPPCKPDVDCKLWGTGVLRLVVGETRYIAATTLTCAGCEACSEVVVTQDDLGSIRRCTGYLTKEFKDTLTFEMDASQHRLAEVVEALPKTKL